MNLGDLQESIAALAASRHRLTETNCEGVSVKSWGVALEFDESDAAGKIEDLTQERDDLAKELEASDADKVNAQQRADTAEALLDEVKNESEPGLTLREARKQCVEWEIIAKDNRRICEEARRELTALRQRKGVTVALFANQGEILHVLGQVCTYPDDAPRWKARAKELLAKLYAK